MDARIILCSICQEIQAGIDEGRRRFKTMAKTKPRIARCSEERRTRERNDAAKNVLVDHADELVRRGGWLVRREHRPIEVAGSAPSKRQVRHRGVVKILG